MEEMENVFTGKTKEDAIAEGLKVLGISEEQADIVVLEEGKKKLFGSVKAKVKITKKASDGERASAFIDGLLKILKIPAFNEIVSDGEKIEIEYTGSKTDGNLYLNSLETYFAFRYPLPKEDLTNLTFTAKLTLVAGSADATAFSTISTFMHQTRDGVFEWSKLRPEGYPVGWRYYTSQYVRDPGYDVVLSIPTIGYLN